MKILYLDCFAGISGDMTLGAFIDLGVSKEKLKTELEKLNLDGYRLEISKKSKNGIMATDVDVVLTNTHSHEEHCHNHNHEEHTHDHNHTHLHEEHHHDHNHTHEEHHHRSYKDIKDIILNSDLDDKVKKLSIDIFENVAIAEAKIHGKTIDEVHFHEVGAIDSIVDIVGASICINEIHVDKIISSPIVTGSGLVKCDHGVIPVPAPATLEIIKNNNVVMTTGNFKKEMVTPTGAAIVATIASEYGEIPQGTPLRIGYGSGKRDMDVANVLRLIIIEDKKKQ